MGPGAFILNRQVPRTVQQALIFQFADLLAMPVDDYERAPADGGESSVASGQVADNDETGAEHSQCGT